MASRPANFWDLPPELQLLIIEALPLEDFVTFALSAYSRLRSALPTWYPAMFPIRISRLRRSNAPDPLSRLPNEMIIHIARYIDPRDRMKWVFAHYYTLSHSNPPLVLQLDDEENPKELYKSWLRHGFEGQRVVQSRWGSH